MEEEKKLACAVILQWMNDFEVAYKNKVKGYFLDEKQENTLNWLDTEYADFWCEVAEIKKHWLVKWAEKKKKEIEKELKNGGEQWLKRKFTTQKSNSLNLFSVLNLPRRVY